MSLTELDEAPPPPGLHPIGQSPEVCSNRVTTSHSATINWKPRRLQNVKRHLLAPFPLSRQTELNPGEPRPWAELRCSAPWPVSQPGLNSGPPQLALPVQPTAECEYCECNAFLSILLHPTVVNRTLRRSIWCYLGSLCIRAPLTITFIIAICFTLSYFKMTQTTDFCFGFEVLSKTRKNPNVFFRQWSGSQMFTQLP